jgi:parallel beta-helix repeat protein
VSNTLLERNIAIGAGDDGIDVDSTTTSLRRNTANRNGDLGIEAVPGVIDGGGNQAHGNGNPAQCTNISCM